MSASQSSLCPCQSGAECSKCCEPLIDGTAKPKTAEQLMRARYTAYTRGDMEFIKTTMTREAAKDFDLKAAEKWSRDSEWKGLKVLSTEHGQANDKKGTVEFTATYVANGEAIDHHEVAEFRRGTDGSWLFHNGDGHTHKAGEGHHHHNHGPQAPVVREEPKIGRNDPCPCGSGKKYKKCCAA
jgi:SEC-C motif-containing protein